MFNGLLWFRTNIAPYLAVVKGLLGTLSNRVTSLENLPQGLTDLVMGAGNMLEHTRTDGTVATVDLSLYLDDTNLARITAGVLDPITGIATFSRDDSSTFTLDMSPLLDDTSIIATDAEATAGTAVDRVPTVKQTKDLYHPLTGNNTLKMVVNAGAINTDEAVNANQFSGAITLAEAQADWALA